MSWILDIVAVLIFVLCVWKGHRQGVIKALTGIAAFLAAMIVSLLLNSSVATLAYNTVVEPPILESIDQVLGEGGSVTQGADKALETMPGFIRNLLAKNDITSGQALVNTLTDTAEDGSVAQQISDQVVRPVAMKLLKAICTLLLFLITFLAAHIALRVLDIIAKLPLLKQLNKALGFVAGAVSGALWVLFFSCLLQIVAAAGGPDAIISQAVIEQTHLISWIAGFNPLSGSLRDLLPFA